MDMGVDLDQKVGGQNRKIIGSKNLVFLKPSKTSKVQILVVFFFLFVLQFIVLIKFNFIF